MEGYHYGGAATTSQLLSLSITIIKANELSIQSKLKRKPNAYAQIKAPNAALSRTPVITGSADPVWQKRLTLTEVEMSSIVSFEVIDNGWASIGSKVVLGRTELLVSALLELSSPDAVLHLNPKGSITISAQKQTASAALADVDGAVDQISHADDISTVSDSFIEIIESLKKLVGFVDSFSTIHPYAHTAWKIVSSVYNVVKAQLDRDIRIVGLVNTMKRLYSFVAPLESMDDENIHSTLESVVQLILRQTIECVAFIQEYVRHGFMCRTTDALISSVDEKITEFKNAFSDLAASLDTGLGLQTTLVSLRIHSRVEELVLRQRLDPVKLDWGGRMRCQPNTRLEVIKTVTNWVFNASGDQTNVLWLHGLVGSGKSTLATSIADFFAELNRLGAFIFFNRDTKEKSHPLTVIRTLAYELSRFDKRIHDQVIKATDSNVHISRMQLDAQFRELLLRPLWQSSQSLSQEGPIVIVIDAFDECGTEGDRDRERLINILAVNFAHLPPSVRIIVTSRVDRDIDTAFRITEIAKHNHGCVPEEWPEEYKIGALVERAAGLFIWASTACKYIYEDYDPEKLLDELVGGQVYEVAEEALDVLYVKALRSAKEWKKPRFKKDACNVLGLILMAKTPLSPDAIDQILDLKSLKIISKLGSVLHHDGNAEPVRILHVSFRDYLSNPTRCKDRCIEKCSPKCDGKCNDGPWFIDLAGHNEQLAQKCIPILARAFGDKFCHLTLDDSRDGQSLDETVTYTCTYWIAHTCEMVSCPQGFDSDLLDFLTKHILHWLEAMSMLGRSRNAASMLEQLYVWVIKYIEPANENLLELLYDAERFAGFFSATIAEHPVLVYMAALPFAPVNSKIYKLFHSGRLPTVLGGYQEWWSPSLRVFERLDRTVQSLAFSPDGSKIISSGITGGRFRNDEYLLRLWDTATGVEAVPALEIDGRNFVEFLQNGEIILSASTTGTLWTLDGVTGKVISELKRAEWATVSGQFGTHETFTRLPTDGAAGAEQVGAQTDALKPQAIADDSVTSASKSLHLSKSLHDPTGMDLDDNSITRTFRPLPFTRAAFSRQGEFAVLGSEDGRLCAIDLARRRQMFSTLKGPSLKNRDVARFFHSIDFSPDGSNFAAGAGDGTISIWETVSGKELMTLKGHSDEVTSLQYGDCDKIISNSEDGTIRTWNALTGDALQVVTAENTHEYQPLDVTSGKERASLEGNFNAVSAIAFSSDGSRLASGAFLNNVQIWDATTVGNLARKTHRRHDRPPYEVQFSPDRLLVRSWRQDSTKFWDTITGKELAMDEYNRNAVFSEDGSVRDKGEDDAEDDDDSAGDVQSPSRDMNEKGDAPSDKKEKLVKHITLLDAETRQEWRKPEAADSPWVNVVMSDISHSLDLVDPDGANLVKIQVSEAKSVTVWRLPLEFRLRSFDTKGSLIAFGIWSGRVFTVHLPEEVVNVKR
ncbi:hypothetical protein IW262DRAFT_1558220 [Armillaria fumosa]|nr:hypothetical protein IW262DRAFT_1558220 [Armillaria fumosa]